MTVNDTLELEAVREYAVTVFNHGISALMDMQLNACPFAKIEGPLCRLAAAGHPA